VLHLNEGSSTALLSLVHGTVPLLPISKASAATGLVGMRITKPCAGDDPFRIEGGRALVNGTYVKYDALTQHELLLSDMSLAPPDRNGKCRRLYDRLGDHADNLFGCAICNTLFVLSVLQWRTNERHTAGGCGLEIFPTPCLMTWSMSCWIMMTMLDPHPGIHDKQGHQHGQWRAMASDED
jgi:hypothetical protein